MAIVTAQPKKLNIMSSGYEADGNLTALENCAVSPSEQASGRMQIKAPSGQGVLTTGILQSNAVTDGLMGEVLEIGYSPAIADSTFNSGDELTTSGTDGKLEAAGSGDYVIAIAYEAATEADQVVAVRVVNPYQKN